MVILTQLAVGHARLKPIRLVRSRAFALPFATVPFRSFFLPDRHADTPIRRHADTHFPTPYLRCSSN
jgi:hypothetical protein